MFSCILVFISLPSWKLESMTVISESRNCVYHYWALKCFFVYSEQKCIRSQKFAAENGFPVMKNVLLPKSKGFIACLDTLRPSLDAGSFSYVNSSISHNLSIYSCIHLHHEFLPSYIWSISWWFDNDYNNDQILNTYSNGYTHFLDLFQYCEFRGNKEEDHRKYYL